MRIFQWVSKGARDQCEKLHFHCKRIDLPSDHSPLSLFFSIIFSLLASLLITFSSSPLLLITFPSRLPPGCASSSFHPPSHPVPFTYSLYLVLARIPPRFHATLDRPCPLRPRLGARKRLTRVRQFNIFLKNKLSFSVLLPRVVTADNSPLKEGWSCRPPKLQ